ncbi:MAG: hypothetical protein DWH86_03530 [Planctomycetota bacterium]|nr:MAG: hypothetical protein DWH86_03530 [Planctomycetota bacterium]
MSHPPNESPGGNFGLQLCDADMRVLDFLAEHGFDASKVPLLPAEDQPRAMALVRQMQVLDVYPADDSDSSLVDATLARIDRWEAASEASMRIQSGRLRNFRLSDFVSVAALILVGVGVLLPIAARIRAQSLSTVCANNMRSLYGGLDNYARDHGGLLPAVASFGNIGSLFSTSPESQPSTHSSQGLPNNNSTPLYLQNTPMAPTQFVFQVPGGVVVIRQGSRDWSGSNHSAHLTQLVALGYTDIHSLQCPACAAGMPCFAYRVPARGQRFVLDTPGRTVVVADSNPMIEARRLGSMPESRVLNSSNHRGSGQNLLFSDGAIEWKTSPILTTSPATAMDNIWLPRDERGREMLDMRSWPSVAADNFVSQ